MSIDRARREARSGGGVFFRTLEVRPFPDAAVRAKHVRTPAETKEQWLDALNRNPKLLSPQK